MRVFFGRGTLGNVRSSKRTIPKVPWTSMSHKWISIEESLFLYFVGMADFKLPALVSGFLCRQTPRYGPMELCLLWRLPRTRYNEHWRAETVQSLYGEQGPLRPRNLISKFTRCSHPFLLIHINSSILRERDDIRNPSSLT